MTEKKSNPEVIVNEGHRVYLDPTHGLHLPDAEALADRGVVTNSQEVHEPGSRVTGATEDVQALEQAGVARAKSARV